MEFVNSIARIVHTSVAIHGGAANKNIGDAFLLVRDPSVHRHDAQHMQTIHNTTTAGRNNPYHHHHHKPIASSQ